MSTIAVEGLTKRYGDFTAVDDLSFTLRPAAITGFLGPNGAGKSTTLQMILGLSIPTRGRATVAGRAYAALADPAATAGALLESASFHPGRSGRDHLRVLATLAGVSMSRVDELLADVELREDAHRRAGGYSLGMRQRLGLAAALLGDPQILILDEPMNGLDPVGIRWLRGRLRTLADEGRTILVSSHVLTELANVVDDVLIINRGRLVTHQPVPAGTDLEALFLDLTADLTRGRHAGPNDTGDPAKRSSHVNAPAR